MRLEQFSVSKFRSIIKAERLGLGDMTVLVGPNNEGKSNLLQALVIGMEELARPNSPRTPTFSSRRTVSRATDGYVWERDFPHGLQHKDKKARTGMRFWFRLTQEELEAFRLAVGSQTNDVLPIELEFGRKTPRAQFMVRKQRSGEALSAKRTEIAEFVAERVQVQYIPSVRGAAVSSDIVRTMVIRELSSMRRGNEDYEAALERLRELQQPVIDALADVLTSKLQEHLADVQSVQILTDDRMNTALRDVRIVVDDGTPTDLDLKGDGVQSLAALALIQHYSTETALAKEFILAVEEPESHLHPKAIHALRGVLRDTSHRQQVVVTTHSPLFINRSELASNIIVERNRARPARDVGELRDVLGVQTSDNLRNAEVVLVVEGEDDRASLDAVLSNKSTQLRDSIASNALHLFPLLGGGNLGYVLTLLRDSLADVQVFLDNDASGKLAAEKAELSGILTPANCMFAMYPGAPESEFEDFVDPMIYRSQMLVQFGVNVLSDGLMNRHREGKWSDRLRRVFQAQGTPLGPARLVQAKAVVAASVAAQPDVAIRPVVVGVVDSLQACLERKLGQRGL